MRCLSVAGDWSIRHPFILVAVHVLIALQNEPYPYDRRVRQEAEALTAAGHTVTVCGPTGFGFDAPREMIDGVRVLRHPQPRPGRGVISYLVEYAASLWGIRRLIRLAASEARVDAAIVCSPPDLLILPTLFLRRTGSALIFDHHDLSPELFEVKFGKRAVFQRAVLLAERFALRHADVVIATNDTYADLERRRGPIEDQRIFVVRNGPDPNRIYPVPACPELKQGHEELICWVGLMSKQEGLHHLLDAAEHLVRRKGRKTVGFAIVGAGDARDDLIAETARRQMSAHIHFPGRADDELVRAYMSTADVCVGVDEPNPMNDASTMTKIVEYMLMGRPIVQFPLTETARVCGDACLYARPGDPVHLAEQIEELLDNPSESTRLGALARQRALAGLLWPQQVPSLLDAVATAVRLRAARE
jgi:glycosyltransferase involved in cell wall biosynthesis